MILYFKFIVECQVLATFPPTRDPGSTNNQTTKQPNTKKTPKDIDPTEQAQSTTPTRKARSHLRYLMGTFQNHISTVGEGL